MFPIFIEGPEWFNFRARDPSGSTQNLFQVQDNVTKVIGQAHYQVRRHFIDMIADQLLHPACERRLRIYHAPDSTWTDQSPDYLGERSAGATSYPPGFLESSAFFERRFPVRPNLTLNLGFAMNMSPFPSSRATNIERPCQRLRRPHLRPPQLQSNQFHAACWLCLFAR